MLVEKNDYNDFSIKGVFWSKSSYISEVEASRGLGQTHGYLDVTPQIP